MPVTVSDRKSATHGVRFVGNFFASRKKIKLTLFYTIPKPDETGINIGGKLPTFAE